MTLDWYTCGHMNYVDVSTFLTLVAEGSVLGAAKTLGVSRATVRRRLAALEKSLGRPLLEREADAVVLTTVGRLLQREGPSLVGAARRLEGALKQVGTEVSGTLTVAMLNGLPGALFTAFARELAERWPSMEVVAVFTPDPLRELERQADVAITSGERPGEPWVARVLAHEEEGAFAHRQYLERAGRPRTLADLEHHRLLSWSTADVSARAWPLRRGGTYAPRPVLTTNDLRSLASTTASMRAWASRWCPGGSSARSGSPCCPPCWASAGGTGWRAAPPGGGAPPFAPSPSR
jgi:DNA-binding transcriptional LysR family regulator